MRKPGGALQVSDGYSVTTADTITCGHCQRICERTATPFMLGVQRDNTDELYKCGGCYRWVCLPCAQKMRQTNRCETIERRLDEYEARKRLIEA